MRRASMRSKKARQKPWWLAGEEECPHCGQLYAYEVEVRCVACDGPICPHCSVRSASMHYCPDCGASGGDIAEAGT
jgi:transcription elongation factor Elf1